MITSKRYNKNFNNYNNINSLEEKRRASFEKRTAVVRREKSILFALFVGAFLFTLLFFNNKTNAKNFAGNDDSVKMYKSITIYSGDTFESIANEYMSDEYSSQVKYIKEMLSINGMSEDSKLIPGNNIIIPYYMSKSIAQTPMIEISLAQ